MPSKRDIKDIHPELEPINGAPSLFSFYGCGLRLAGNRDYSQESQSTVKTLFLSLFYVPLIPLKAYRVVEDGQRTYFLGKVPVSKTARKTSMAGIAIGALAIGGFGTQQYLSSEGHKFGKTLAQAESAVEEDRFSDAMQLYKTVYDNSDSYRLKASSKMAGILQQKTLQTVDNAELASVLDTYNSFAVSPVPRMHDKIYDYALERVKTDTGQDDVSLHRLLRETEELNPDGEDLSEMGAALAKSINEADPTNLDAALEISELYFLDGDFESVKHVLNPVKDKLGDNEGARILAQTYISEGRNADAYPLLSGYTGARLKAFQQAENRFTEISDKLWETEFDRLNDGLGPDSFYSKYEKTPASEQQQMVDTYLGDIVYNKPKYLDALAVYRDAAKIVPVAMDFGILQLRRAEGLSSQAEREAELNSAEETFLSIRNVAGDSEDYKIYLGQVYFWLGKQEQGQALFDELLAANDRAPQSLMSVALTLRSLGKLGGAKELAQEAYDTSSADEMKFQSAHILNLLSTSLEDKVEWLERADPDAPNIQASLKETKGMLAAQKDDTAGAVKFYKEAINHSESLPENAVTFNNTALIYFSLHDVTGDKAAFKKGTDLMSEAVSLMGDDSILLTNAADTLLVNSLFETFPETVQYEKLKSRPSVSNLSWYYHDAAEKESLRQKLRQNEDFLKAIEYYERGILLAPNNADTYDALSDIYFFLDDEKPMADLVSRMAENQVDLSQNKSLFLDYVNGIDADKTLTSLKEREAVFKDLLKQKGLNAQTKGALQYSQASNLLSQINFGETNRVADAVALGKLARKNMPSNRTETQYITSLFSQASLEAASALSLPIMSNAING